MVISFNKLSKIEKSTVLLPELTVEVRKGDIVAIQSEYEYIDCLFNLLNHPQSIEHSAITLPEGGFRNVCLIQQNDGLYKRLTVLQTIRFWCKLYRSNVDEAYILNACELQTCTFKKIKQLTPSEQSRLLFSLPIIQEVSVYIFEDPSLGLDLQSKSVLHKLIRRLATNGAAVMLFTPTLEEAISLGSSIYRYSSRGIQKLNQDEQTNEKDMEETDKKDTEKGQIGLNKISAKIDDKIMLFNPLDIDYIEAREGKTYLFVNNEEFISSHTIKDLDELLHSYGFFRCHRSYLVNLQRVREIIIWSKNSYSLTLDNAATSTIPLSKGNYSMLKELIYL